MVAAVIFAILWTVAVVLYFGIDAMVHIGFWSAGMILVGAAAIAAKRSTSSDPASSDDGLDATELARVYSRPERDEESPASL